MSVLDLPEEIIETIMCKNNDSLQDFVNFSSTSKHFYHMLNSNTFWRWKFYKRWSRLKNVCQNEMDKIHFKEAVSARLSCVETVQLYLKEMSKKWYTKLDTLYDKSCSTRYLYDDTYVNEKDLDSLLHGHNNYGYSVNYQFLVDELTCVIKKLQSYDNCNLTQSYYGKKLLTYLNRYHVKKQWHKFTERPAKQQLFEEVTTIFFQLYQPEKELLYSDVDKYLDNLAQDVITNLKETHPVHPLLSVSREQLSFWKCYNINRTEWDNSEARSILFILYNILFKDTASLCTAYSQTYKFVYAHLTNVSNAFVPWDMEDFHRSLSLGVILQCAARRLGVLCDLICINRNDYFLIWMPKNDTTKADRVKGFSIHLKKGKPILLEEYLSEIRVINNHTYMKITSAQLLTDFIHYTISNIKYLLVTVDQKVGLTEFQFKLKPDIDSFEDLVQAYTETGMKDNILKLSSDLPEFFKQLQRKYFEMSQRCPFHFLLEPNPAQRREREEREKNHNKRYNLRSILSRKQRNPRMKFAVGMVGRFPYEGTSMRLGVILGWREVVLESSYLLLLLVCCHNGNIYCISEDNFRRSEVSYLFSPKVLGKYFCRVEDTYYMPNELLAAEYPEDISFLLNRTYP